MACEFFRQLSGATERHDIRHGFSPGTAALLLPATDNEWRQFHSATDVERADAFRRVKLVT